MRRNVQEPVTVEDSIHWGRHATRTTHPAFAQISASRVTGHTTLYGSDFTHNHTIRIRISGSELHRSLNHDSHFPKEQLIEVEMSEAQWATFVSSLNCGSGPPCTLKYLGRESVPELPPPVDRTQQFSGEVATKLKDVIEDLTRLSNDVEQMGLPKGKTNQILGRLSALKTQFNSNLPFVAESFEKHMENTVEAAKTEVHGYITNAVMRSGLEALQGGSPLLLETTNE